MFCKLYNIFTNNQKVIFAPWELISIILILLLFHWFADRRNSVFLQSTWTFSSVTYPQWVHSKFIGWPQSPHIVLTYNFSEPHDLQIVSVTFLQIMPLMFTYYSTYIVFFGGLQRLYTLFYNESRILKNHFYCYAYCVN